MFEIVKKIKAPLAYSALALCLSGTVVAQVWRMQSWPSYGGNPQHTGISNLPAASLSKVLWTTPVDLNPQYSGSDLFIHYAAPLVTNSGNVIVTVKTGASGGFKVEGRNCINGGLVFTQNTDYILPSSGWTPVCGSALVGINGLVTPGAGGTVYLRDRTDFKTATVRQVAFYGMSTYTANKAAFDSNVYVCTPPTVDNMGNIYFGVRVSGGFENPANFTSGIARISANGVGSFVPSTTLTADSSAGSPVLNCAPALSNDQKTLYIAIFRGNGGGYLVGADTEKLTPKFSTRLLDPKSGFDANLEDIGTATPMVGPDGDVYFGVIENPFYNDRGWMLHYDSTLTQSKIPGAFGWDDTASVVPSQCVPSYTGTSKYLILTKYNAYAGFSGGDGVNKLAVLDPNASAFETHNQFPAMKEVITVTGVTPDTGFVNAGYPNAVREWCINSAAIDPRTRSAIVNSEDGHCYRWDFTSNTLNQVLSLSSGIGEAYTPTVIGKFGVSFAINNARLCAMGR